MAIAGIKVDNFEIKITEQLDKVKVQWLGRRESRNPAEILNPYFDNMINQLNGKSITIDYTLLEFMNSSTVPPIIKFIKACSLGGINTVVNYSKDLEWQNASFKPLQTICMMLKNITVSAV